MQHTCVVIDAADSCDTTEGLPLCDPKMLDIHIEEVKEACGHVQFRVKTGLLKIQINTYCQ
jgi:hypothetical protein